MEVQAALLGNMEQETYIAVDGIGLGVAALGKETVLDAFPVSVAGVEAAWGALLGLPAWSVEVNLE